MRIIANIAEVLEKHRKWLAGDSDGEKANLREADLYGADLRGANLRGANLREADLRGADLRGANLYGANLRGADLREADLYGADLREADLYGADLRGANLREADLRGADLRGANLYGANLRGADLREADLYGANIENTIKMRLFPLACPEEGAFIGWKKCRCNGIVKLFIPEDAKRSSAYGRKCRCSKAVVLEITGKDGKPLKTAKSQYDNEFVYTVGETVQPIKPFDEDRWNECASGIHFFITKQEAIDYV